MIFRQEFDAVWLAPDVQHPADLAPVRQPHPAEDMRAYSVSPRVNNPAHDDAARCAPVRQVHGQPGLSPPDAGQSVAGARPSAGAAGVYHDAWARHMRA